MGSVAPKTLKFTTGGSDFVLRQFNTDLGNKEEVRSLRGHSDYVNAVVYEPETGDKIASGSDDHSLILWDSNNGNKIHVFTFRSPVMSISWHPSEVSKMMAAEKIGVLHIFNVVSYHPILSVDYGSGPLSYADWSLTNSLLVVAAIKSDWIVYDLS